MTFSINFQHHLQIFQCVDLIWLLIPAPATDPGKPQGHTRFMAFGFSDSFKGDFKYQFRFDRPYRTKFFVLIFLYKMINFIKFLVG